MKLIQNLHEKILQLRLRESHFYGSFNNFTIDPRWYDSLYH